MSVSNFISASIITSRLGKKDVALALACSAIDGTAKKLYPLEKRNNERYKNFLKSHMRIIIVFGFPGILASSMRIKCRNIPDIKTDENGFIGIEDIIYHVIRCGLIHQCEIDDKLLLVPETSVGDFGNSFKIPENIIWGLILSAVLCEENWNERIEEKIYLSIGGKDYPVNELWGRKSSIMQLFDTPK